MTAPGPIERVRSGLVATLAAALDPDERTVVLGDLAESRTTAAPALREVAGLVARRQLAAWTAAGPWLALLAIALPLGALLSHVTRWWSDGSVVYLRAYVEGFTWTYLANPGSRLDLAQLATGLLLKAVALWVWSWTAGFALATLSRRALWLTGGAFAIALVAATLGTATTARGPLGDGLSSSHFYGVVLPRLFRAGLVLLPAWLGVRAAGRAGALALKRGAATALLAVALVAWTARGVESSVTFGRSSAWTGPGADGTWGTADDPRPIPLRLLPFALAVPAIFLGATALATHRSRRLSACSEQAQRR